MPLSDAKAELQELAKALIQAGKEDEATAVLAQVKTLEADVMRMAISSPSSKAKAQLEERAKRLIDEGKTDEATAVLAQIKAIEAEPASALFGRLAGKWTRHGFQEHFVVTRDGVWKRVSNDAKNTVLDSVTLQMLTPDVAEVRYPSGWRLECRLAGEDILAVSESRPDRSRTQGFVLERTK